MAKNRILYLLFLLGAFVFYLFYFAWFSWYLLILAAFFPILSLLCSLPAMVMLKPELTCPAAAGRDLPVTISARNTEKFFMPAPTYRFSLNISNAMTGKSVTQQAVLAGGRSFQSRLDTSHCGACTCTITKGYVYDYLGLFRFPVTPPKPVELLVMPLEKEIEPRPNPAMMQYKTYHPKAGGGFSEIHDMRQYRPGDSMRDIHWKLSTKLDQLIVREAQEPDRRQVIISFDFSGSADTLDSTLDQLMWLSRWLTAQDTEHDIIYLDPADMEPQRHTINSGADLEVFICRLLRQRAAEVSGVIGAVRSADWHYHIYASKGDDSHES